MGWRMDLVNVCSKFDAQNANDGIIGSERVFFQFFGAFEELEIAWRRIQSVAFGASEHAR